MRKARRITLSAKTLTGVLLSKAAELEFVALMA